MIRVGALLLWIVGIHTVARWAYGVIRRQW